MCYFRSKLLRFNYLKNKAKLDPKQISTSEMEIIRRKAIAANIVAPSYMLLGLLDTPQVAATTFYENPVEQKKTIKVNKIFNNKNVV